jgi:tetratricopeptide (TPR) repeat protein/transcriptional regulator with XRE-family HTH domain
VADETGLMVRRLRLRAGLTQEGLAERSGVSVRTIRGIETGNRRNPQLASLVRLADALELSADDRGDLLTSLVPSTSAVTAPPVNATAKPVVVPRQLPAVPASFVGRRTELDRLDAVPAGTVVIAGPGGIGKTWLALNWAHRHRDRFPDGQLFVDLRGFSPDERPMDPDVALRGFLDTLGVEPGRVPTEPHARSALFRSLVAGKRMLLVLDNATGTGQVVPLLPGGDTCTVLITSRARPVGLIAGHDAHLVPVGTLSVTEARALLTRRLGMPRITAEPAAVDEMIEFCGGFPLALGVVAGHAGIRPQLPLATLVTDLREMGLDLLDHDDPVAGLPTVLSWSLHHLTIEQRTVFALLGIAPGPDIGLPAAASLTALPVARIRKVVRALEEASLLSRDTHGRCAMHDLVRAYAITVAHDLAEPVRQAALERVVDFYLHATNTADRLLNPHRRLELDPPAPGTLSHPLTDTAAALAWLTVEHQHVLAAQHTAETQRRYRVVWQLAWTLYTFFVRRGYRDEVLATWQAAVAATAHLSDPAARALAHRRLGRAYARLGQHEDAISHLRRALDLAEDPTEQAHIHHAFAAVWERHADYRRALEHARRARDLYRRLDLPLQEAHALTAMGSLAVHLGDYDAAREHCQTALVLCRRHRDPAGEADALSTLGRAARHAGHHNQAVHYYREALHLYRTLGNTTAAAGTLVDLGRSHHALAQRTHARAAWQEALELYRQQGRHADTAQVQQQLDDLDRRNGDPSAQDNEITGSVIGVFRRC